MEGQSRKGFTLIELLVVIAIIAILAAILFPVFAKAREKARQTSCLNNLKQIALASIQYTQDYDEYFYPHRWQSGANPDAGNVPAATPLTGDAAIRTFWPQIIMPYIKANGVFICPSNPNGWTVEDPKNPTTPCSGIATNTHTTGCDGVGYGWQNSYGHNDMWMSPASANGGASGLILISQANISRPSRVILCADATYYGLAPDAANQSGGENYDGALPASNATAATLQTADQKWVIGQDPTDQTSVATCYYCNYWHNMGNSTYDWSALAGATAPVAPDNTTTQTLIDIQGRHTSFINCAFTDGHVKALTSTDAALNMCNWVLDNNMQDKDPTVTNVDHSALCNGR